MDKPYFFVFEITKKCNNDCFYCYNVWKERADYPTKELELAEIEKLFGKIFAKIKPQNITLTGGEPMLRTDIYEIATLAKNCGAKVGIATNGTLLDEEKTDRLVACGITYFDISLVSLDKDRYATLSNNDKLSDLKRAILAVKKRRIPLTLSFTITKINIADIGDFIDLGFSFSADNLALNRFVPGGRGLKNIEMLAPSASEFESVLGIANDRAEKYRVPVNITVPVEACRINHKKYPRLNFGACVCGRQKWAIDPAGNLRTCEQNPDILGNLLEKSFAELIETNPAKKFQESNFHGNCIECGDFGRCGGGCRFLRDKAKTPRFS
ncbi:MAG: radical SAM protein [Candidatus Pacebacteria bacterium]|jgi:radical SAM protein with 4Fe4S-binding SPASM domain|nr:radical SAM protein [Candidatus Paceibacterota bacterium]